MPPLCFSVVTGPVLWSHMEVLKEKKANFKGLNHLTIKKKTLLACVSSVKVI